MNPNNKQATGSENPQPSKVKKEKNSLHNLPKLDKTQLYFNSYHTQTPAALKQKPNTEIGTNPKSYFINNKRAVTKGKTTKDQNKSITNFLDITISQNFLKDQKNPDSIFKTRQQEKETNLEVRSGEAKFSKPHTKHKNSCGNSLTLEKNFLSNDKSLRPSLYETASSKSKEYFNQSYYNNKHIKQEEKKQDKTAELEVILTEASENNMNEFPSPNSKQAVLTLFTREALFGSKNIGTATRTETKESNGNYENRGSGQNEKGEIENLFADFIVKNQDTGWKIS